MRIEKPDYLRLSYEIMIDGGEAVRINAAAYADDLILDTKSHEDMNGPLECLEQFVVLGR
jgi:hypothetical protein